MKCREDFERAAGRLLPTMGTDVYYGTRLFHDGVLDRLGVELIGAKADVIAKAEDGSCFMRR